MFLSVVLSSVVFLELYLEVILRVYYAEMLVSPRVCIGLLTVYISR